MSLLISLWLVYTNNQNDSPVVGNYHPQLVKYCLYITYLLYHQPPPHPSRTMAQAHLSMHITSNRTCRTDRIVQKACGRLTYVQTDTNLSVLIKIQAVLKITGRLKFIIYVLYGSFRRQTPLNSKVIQTLG